MTDFPFICIFIGGGLLYHSLKAHRLRRKIEDIPTSRIASAPQGLVELQGFAWPLRNGRNLDQTATTLDGRAAVYRKLVIEEKKRSGKNSHWEEIHREEHAFPFLIFDDSGEALVTPMGSDLQLHEETRAWGSLDERLRATLNGSVPAAGAILTLFRQLRVKESFILMGSPVYALGSFRSSATGTKASPASGYQEFRRKLGRSLSNSPRLAPSFAGATARDLSTSFNTAARVAKKGSAQAIQVPLHETESESEVLPAGTLAHDSTHPLIIADCHQHHLVARFGLLNHLKMLGGAALIGYAVVDFIFGVSGK